MVKSATTRCYRNFSIISVTLLFTISSQLCNAENLADHPFWQRSSGYWLSLNTYLDGDFEYKIKHYHSITHISVIGLKVTMKEYKFYPPGYFNGKYIGLSIPENMGVELLNVSNGETNKDSNSVDFNNNQLANTQTQLTTFTEDSALMTVTNTLSLQDSYRMLITMPSKDSRVVVNLGLNNQDSSRTKGALRGLSILSATRISDKEFDTKVKELREEYQIGILVSLDNNNNYQAIPLKP